MQYTIPRGTQAVMGIPIGKLQNLDSRVKSLETNGAFSIKMATGTVDNSNTSFTFTTAPTVLVINGGIYAPTGGAITWTGTTSVTLSSPVGSGGSIFGL